MDSKASVWVFLSLVLVFACLALGNLVEISPDAIPPHNDISMPALLIQAVQVNAFQADEPSPIQRFFSLPKSSFTDVPVSLERDRNGLPLDREIYRLAAYQKFPPEGFHG